MQPYLTPERLRTMRTGAVLTGFSTLDIVELISDASAIADAYCNVAMTPKPHSFRGGVVLAEEHIWQYPTSHFDPGQRRIYLFHQPIVSVQALRLYVSATASAAIPEETLYINHTERWVEVTSLAIASNSGLFGVTGWVVPIGGMANPVAQVDYTYGNTFEEVGERAYPITDDDKRVFQTAHGFWTDDAVTVYVDGVTKTLTTDYTVDREIGRITMTADTTGKVTIDYAHTMDISIPKAVGHIAANLAGADKNARRGLVGGVQKIKVGEISLDRGAGPAQNAQWLDQAVPEAALLLSGHKMYWMA